MKQLIKVLIIIVFILVSCIIEDNSLNYISLYFAIMCFIIIMVFKHLKYLK